MKIFTYGSNFYINWLKERIPSAIKVCNASVEGCKFSFNIRSNVDGLAKGKIQQTNEAADKVCGVVFEMAEIDKWGLDESEAWERNLIKSKLSFSVIKEIFSRQNFIWQSRSN